MHWAMWVVAISGIAIVVAFALIGAVCTAVAHIWRWED